MSKDNLTGRRFGRVVVISDSGQRAKNNETMWKCECDCGTMFLARHHGLLNGYTRSCGCLKADAAKTRVQRSSDTGPLDRKIVAMLKEGMPMKQVAAELGINLSRISAAQKRENYYIRKKDNKQ